VVTRGTTLRHDYWHEELRQVCAGLFALFGAVFHYNGHQVRRSFASSRSTAGM